MSNGKKAGVAIFTVLALGLAFLIGFVVGSDTSGTVNCDTGEVVSVEVSGADEFGNGTRIVKIGACDRLSDDTFVSVVEALVGSATTTTDTTEKPAETTTTTGSPQG